MNSTGLTLSPASLRTLLDRWLGPAADCLAIGPLHGGMCSTVLELKISVPPNTAVVKLSNAPDPHFEAEAERLDYLRAQSQMSGPPPVFLGHRNELNCVYGKQA